MFNVSRLYEPWRRRKVKEMIPRPQGERGFDRKPPRCCCTSKSSTPRFLRAGFRGFRSQSWLPGDPQPFGGDARATSHVQSLLPNRTVIHYVLSLRLRNAHHARRNGHCRARSAPSTLRLARGREIGASSDHGCSFSPKDRGWTNVEIDMRALDSPHEALPSC